MRLVDGFLLSVSAVLGFIAVSWGLIDSSNASLSLTLRVLFGHLVVAAILAGSTLASISAIRSGSLVLGDSFQEALQRNRALGYRLLSLALLAIATALLTLLHEGTSL